MFGASGVQPISVHGTRPTGSRASSYHPDEPASHPALYSGCLNTTSPKGFEFSPFTNPSVQFHSLLSRTYHSSSILPKNINIQLLHNTEHDPQALHEPIHSNAQHAVRRRFVLRPQDRLSRCPRPGRDCGEGASDEG